MKKIKRSISLSNKFILYSLVILSALFLCLLYIFIKDAYIKNNQLIFDLSSEISFIEKSFDDSSKYSSLILNSMISEISKSPSDKKYIEKTLRKYRILHESKMKNILTFSMFSWVDADNKLVVNSEVGIIEKFIDMSNRDYLKFTRQQPNELYFGKPVIGAVSRQNIIPAGVGFIDRSSKYRGSVVMGFDLDNIYNKFLSNRFISGSNLQIVYKNELGIIKNSFVLDSNYLLKINPQDPTIQILSQAPIFSSSPTIIYKRIDNTPYGLVLKFNNSNQIDSIKRSYLLEFISILMLLFVLVYLLKKNFINPIVQLSKQANLVKEDGSKISLPTSKILEINQLSKAILSIKEYIDQEQSLKKKLAISNESLNLVNKNLSKVNKVLNHDIRNYLSGISGLAELISQENDFGKIKDYSTIIASQSNRMLVLSNSLLDKDFSNADKLEYLGKIPGRGEVYCDISQILKEILFVGQKFISKEEVKISLQAEDNLPPILCDEIRLRQILDNLISNAVKYSHRNGEVKIICRLVTKLENQQQICIEIQDNGIGMSEEDIKMALAGKGKDIDKLSLDKQINSHGIGLPLVKDIVEIMNSKMEIESKKGEGTTIRLWFDVNLGSSEKEIILPNQKTILIADDEAVNLLVLGNILKSAQYNVIKSKDGVSVLEKLENYKCDLIVMDVEMPIMNGIKTTKEIRSRNDKKYHNIPIIAFSGNIDQDSKQEALESGMNDYLEKPFSKQKVLDLIKNYVK